MLFELWTVGKALWQNDYSSAIYNLSAEWPNDLQPLTFALREKLLFDQLQTVGSAYNHIPIEQLSAKLGIDQEETTRSNYSC